MEPGTRVVLKENFGVYRKGDCGVVLDIDNTISYNLPILFDKKRTGGHNFYGRINEKRGYWVDKDKLIKNKTNNISAW